jgi:hypothetical protein
MKFVLRMGFRDVELPLGRFIIGRAEGSGLSLDDALVSRQHAALVVTDGSVTVEDLGSRNGLTVNGERLMGSRPLALDDVIVIGKTEMVLALRRDLPSDTLVQHPTQRLPAFGLIGMLTEKALALGRGDEAERLLGPQLDQLIADAASGRRIDGSVVERAAEYSLRIAALTGLPKRVDTVFQLYAALGRPCSSAVVDELYAVVRKVQKPSSRELRRYLDVLRSAGAELGPAERFLVSRLEGLERSLG